MHQFSSIPFLEQFYVQLSEKPMLYGNTNVSHLKDSLLFSVSRGSLVQLHLQNLFLVDPFYCHHTYFLAPAGFIP
jgi:hypothetical protein